MAVRLTLHVMGGTHRSNRAIRNLRRAIEAADTEVELEVVDLIEQPERGERDRILATPTLVRTEPGPVRRIVGDLSVPEAVQSVLGEA